MADNTTPPQLVFTKLACSALLYPTGTIYGIVKVLLALADISAVSALNVFTIITSDNLRVK